MKLGSLLNLADSNTLLWITEMEFNHDENQITKLRLGSQSRDIAEGLSSLADRQHIEMAYSQGGTTLFAESENGNADSANPLVMRLLIPANLQIINAVMLDVRLTRFRLNHQATEGGGAVGTTTPSNISLTFGPSTERVARASATTTTPITGRADTSTNAIGNLSVATQAGFAIFIAPVFNSPPAPNNNPWHFHDGAFGSVGNVQHTHNLNHSHTMNHSHGFNHTHGLNHTHGMAHTHDFVAPDHTHSIAVRMMTYNSVGTSFQVRINGAVRHTQSGVDGNINILPWLLNQGILVRGAIHTIEILPNLPSQVRMTARVQAHLNSRGNRAL